MKSSRMIYLLSLTVIGLALAACAGAAPTPAGPASPQKTVTMKFATALPEQDPLTQAGLRFTRDVEERTKKTSVAVRFEYFLASQLYAANQIPRAIAEGALDSGQPYSSVIGGEMIPAILILDAPLLWDDLEQTLRAEDGEVGQILAAELEKQNLKVLWFNHAIPYEFLGRDKPIIRPEDAKGKRVRALGGLYDELFQAIGATGVNVPSAEQYSALQRSIVDAGGMQQYGTLLSRKLYEVAEYATKGGKFVSSGNPITVNLDVWKSLPKDTQDAFLAASKEAQSGQVNRLNQEYEETARELESKGMKLIQMSDADRKAWFAYRKAVEDAYLKKAGDLGKQVLQAADKYRK